MNIFKQWFSHQAIHIIDNSRNPWAGLASYEDPETAEHKLKFCGRDDDSYDLAKLVMNNIFVTLYGKSGIGKTSLINAGVFPELREEQYEPLSLRLGMRDEEHPESYQSMLIKAIEQKINHVETVNVIDEQANEEAVEYLWNYFARHRFYDKYDELTTPVIVFDQFEEVFRIDRKEAETLLRQLDYLNDKDHALDNCTIEGKPYRYEQNYRFLVSIREDDLYRLEDSIDNCLVPALKRCRYRLRSLTEEGARDAIFMPGEGLFNAEEQENIAKTIIDKSRNQDGSISTNIISMLCSRIFVDFQRSGADHITYSLVDAFLKGRSSSGRMQSRDPFERFYNDATRGFSNREKSYIEDHLVDGSGRRNSIPESDFLLHVKNGAALLEGERKILQRTSTSSDNYRIELIHDSFCEPLTILAKKRERRRRLAWIILIASIMAAYVVMGFFISHLNTKVKQKMLIIDLYEQDISDSDNPKNYLDLSYTVDGIEYKHGFPTRKQMDKWKKDNHDLCSDKIEPIIAEGKYDVDEDMIEKDPCLVYLILQSLSLEKEEDKQEWFNMWYIMNKDQKRQLYFILYTEVYKRAVLRYRSDVKIFNQQSYDYAQKGDYGQALTTIDMAIDDARIEYASTCDSKGEILLMKGDTLGAVDMWEKVMDIAPDFLQYYKSTTLYEQLKERGLIEKSKVIK